MFASQQLENRVAEQLGLITDSNSTKQTDVEQRAARAPPRWRHVVKIFGGDEVDGEGSIFIHWWRWDREARGFRRWFVAVFGRYFVALFF